MQLSSQQFSKSDIHLFLLTGQQTVTSGQKVLSLKSSCGMRVSTAHVLQQQWQCKFLLNYKLDHKIFLLYFLSIRIYSWIKSVLLYLMVSDFAQNEEYPLLSAGDQVVSSQSFLSVYRTSRRCISSHLPRVSLPVDVSCPSCLSSVDFPSHTCLCFIREGLRHTVCSDSCSNSHTCFQRADVFSGASHAYFPQGDAFRHRPELELKWHFTRNMSWETWEVEWQNTPWADTDRVVFVRVCLYLTAVAKLSESCDNWSQMFESSSAVILLIF